MNYYKIASHPSVLAKSGLALPQHPLANPPAGMSHKVYMAKLFVKSIGLKMDRMDHRLVGGRDDLARRFPSAIELKPSDPTCETGLSINDFPQEGTYFEAPINWLEHAGAEISDEMAQGAGATLVSHQASLGSERYPIAIIYRSTTRDPLDPEATLFIPRPKEGLEGGNNTSFHMRETDVMFNGRLDLFQVFPGVRTAYTIHGGMHIAKTNDKLAEMRGRNPNMRILAMGSGAGPEVRVFAGVHGFHVDAVDIDPVAVANTLGTATYLGIDPTLVRAWVSDLFDNVEERYDAIVFCAPAVVAAEDEMVRTIHDPGGELLKRFLREAPDHLNEDGAIYLMSPVHMRPFLPRDPRRLSSKVFYENRHFEEFMGHEIRHRGSLRGFASFWDSIVG